MLCPVEKCNTEVRVHDRYCPGCGNSISHFVDDKIDRAGITRRWSAWAGEPLIIRDSSDSPTKKWSDRHEINSQHIACSRRRIFGLGFDDNWLRLFCIDSDGKGRLLTNRLAERFDFDDAARKRLLLRACIGVLDRVAVVVVGQEVWAWDPPEEPLRVMRLPDRWTFSGELFAAGSDLYALAESPTGSRPTSAARKATIIRVRPRYQDGQHNKYGQHRVLCLKSEQWTHGESQPIELVEEPRLVAVRTPENGSHILTVAGKHAVLELEIPENADLNDQVWKTIAIRLPIASLLTAERVLPLKMSGDSSGVLLKARIKNGDDEVVGLVRLYRDGGTLHVLDLLRPAQCSDLAIMTHESVVAETLLSRQGLQQVGFFNEVGMEYLPPIPKYRLVGSEVVLDVISGDGQAILTIRDGKVLRAVLISQNTKNMEIATGRLLTPPIMLGRQLVWPVIQEDGLLCAVILTLLWEDVT